MSTTTDHDEIRRWAEERGGRPATAKSTESGGEPGVLRFDFNEREFREAPLPQGGGSRTSGGPRFRGSVVPVKSTGTRTYVQRGRARAAQANTERIMQAALELFVERPFDQITLGAVAERAGVGLQTVIRRVGTKDGLVRASGEWVAAQIMQSRGAPPTGDDPRAVAEAIARQYERWGAVTDRTLRQEDASPALGEMAEQGRINHRAWIQATFAQHLDALSAGERHALRARLVGVTGIELWQVLRRVEGLSVEQATRSVAELIAACLPTTHGRES